MTQGGRLPHELTAPPETTLAALLDTDPATAERQARAMLAQVAVDAPGPEAPLALVAVDYASGSPATGGLYRLHVTSPSGTITTLFCKVVHHVRHWPGLAQLPHPVAQAFAAEFPWRTELELWDPLVQASLPAGLRSPRLLALIDLGDDRLAAWQEDVAARTDPWSPAELGHAATLLGRWNARCAEPDLLATSPYPPGHGLRMYGERSVPMRGLAPLQDDALWSHPWLREHADLRAGLRDVGARIPDLLDRLDTLPQTLPHGDASPQNLLRPLDGGDLVAIDLSFRTPHALGFDLGQLLVGSVHAGEIPAARLPAIAEVILPGYLDGLGEAGVDPRQVAWAFATATLIRSGFDGFLYGLLETSDPADEHAFAERVALSRFLLTQYREHEADAPGPARSSAGA